MKCCISKKGGGGVMRKLLTLKCEGDCVISLCTIAVLIVLFGMTDTLKGLPHSDQQWPL